ncbi:AsmA-like C-terminal region-containing protein [Candidatus Pelagibacter sp.]|nr:AsmA-like C-terminal region-containing protein [Candidatus Pelagibacter sp.]
MTKKIVKIIFVIFLSLALIIFYLSFFGIKTKIFNSEIKNKLSKINPKIQFNINEVNYLLNPVNFNFNIITKNSQILIEGKRLDLKNIKTNISLNSLINGKFLIDELQISTEKIKLNDLVLLARTAHNTPQLFILNTIIKDGTIAADISMNFNRQGKIKDNYQIKGLIKNTRLNLLNKSSIKGLNFSFDIKKNKYSLSKISARYNEIKFSLPSVQIEEKKDLYLIKGTLISKDQKLEGKDLKLIFRDLLNNYNIKKTKFSSQNKFSFNIDRKLKIKNFKMESVLDLDQAILIDERINLKPYFSNSKEEIKFENHKIKINYEKDKLIIEGKGNIFLTDKSEQAFYKIIKSKDQLLFDTKLNVKNNSLVIEFLDYKKEEGVNSIISINGDIKKNGSIKFESISLKENKNKILINNLKLSQTFKIIDVGSANINYKNNKNFSNKINLKKDNSNFIIEGTSLYLAKLIDDIMKVENEDSSIFQKLNTRINIKIKKTYINEINYLNNLSGYINFKNNKINNLNLDSVFSNNKKISLTIETNDAMEITTRLLTDYPKPLVEKYKFIKGFEEGYLDFSSIKKDNVSNSVLIIDNFKVQEVPIFAKLLSLASLQGIADILTGEGIRFTALEMRFLNQKGLTTIDEMYAIGPAVSLLMNGYIEKNKLVSLRGTLVPATTINKSIASIPFLGDLLIGEKVGEGVFGVSFKIKGPPNDLSTTVNPIKTLTPRFITRTLEKIKKN